MWNVLIQLNSFKTNLMTQLGTVFQSKQILKLWRERGYSQWFFQTLRFWGISRNLLVIERALLNLFMHNKKEL